MCACRSEEWESMFVLNHRTWLPLCETLLDKTMRLNRQSRSAILKDLHQHLFGHEVQVIRLTPPQNLHGPISLNILHILWRFLPLHALHQILCHLLPHNIVLAFKRTSCSKTRNNFRQASDQHVPITRVVFDTSGISIRIGIGQ